MRDLAQCKLSRSQALRARTNVRIADSTVRRTMRAPTTNTLARMVCMMKSGMDSPRIWWF
jgi:hypothetical protein